MKKAVLFTTALLVALLLLFGCNNTSYGETKKITVDGIERNYILYTPPTINSNQPVPLVIALHGGGGNADSIARMTELNTLADKEKFIAAYPNGSGRLGDALLTWNAFTCCGYAVEQNTNDIGFIEKMIEKIKTEKKIDEKKIYATGFSNGAYMTYLIGCKLSDEIAAIAPVSGAIGEPCEPTTSIPVIAFHGTDDEYVLYNGGVTIKNKDKRPADKSVQYAMNFWSQNNNCNTEPTTSTDGNIEHKIYTGCKNNAAVELYTILNGGHAWPGSKPGIKY
jgi:polyhydroxybutyrate depolymerase